MTDSIRDLLRAAISQRYSGNMTRLAEAVGAPVQSVSKWVADDERKRTVPGPASCQKIACGLDLDADYVLELAGHRSAEHVVGVDLDQSELDARLSRLSRVLGRYPRVFWVAVVEAYERMAQVGEVWDGPARLTSTSGSAVSDAVDRPHPFRDSSVMTARPPRRSRPR